MEKNNFSVSSVVIIGILALIIGGGVVYYATKTQSLHLNNEDIYSSQTIEQNDSPSMNVPVSMQQQTSVASGTQEQLATLTTPAQEQLVLPVADLLAASNICPQAPLNSNKFALCGYIVDPNSNPLAGVQMSSSTVSGVSAVTNANGYFSVEFPVSQAYDCDNPVIFTYTKSGYKTLNYVLKGYYVSPGGNMGIQLMLNPGSGTEQKTDKHGMCS